MNTLKDLAQKDGRYAPDGFQFVLEALDFTAKKMKQDTEKRRHVSGGELLEGIRAYALHQFGPLSLTLLNSWGIRNTRDFGEIVFILVKSGKLRKTEEDAIEDFEGSYDFDDAFVAPFLPDDNGPSKLSPPKRTYRKRKDNKRKGGTHDGTIQS
jgi:uncharacterized repeat protein (TIGR04138 family)